MAQRVNGACLCGSVRFELRTPTAACAHCHCTMCQRAHGAAYVTWVVLPRAHFKLLAGEDDLVRYRSSEHGSRSFCGRCGSSLFCDSTHHPDSIDVVLANLEGPLDRGPQMHVYWDDRADWVKVGDALPRLGGKTGTEPVDS